MNIYDKFAVITFAHMVMSWLVALLVYSGIIPNANTGNAISFYYAVALSLFSCLTFVWLSVVTYYNWKDSLL